MLNEFNEGGTHSQNPLGGIPIGQDNQGNPNLVEQGETKKGDFVYSNRVVLTSDVVAEMNLPKSFVGKTAADASKVINSKFKDRNDKISTSTKDNFLDKISKAQESVKAQQQAQIQAAMQANSTQGPEDMMNGQIPQGMEEYSENKMAWGGDSNKFNLSTPGQQPNEENSSAVKTSGKMDYGKLGQMIGSVGDAVGPEGAYGKQIQKNQSAGFYDEQLAKGQADEKMLDTTKDTIAGVIGPIGGLFRGIQKAGKGIGTAIGGETGNAVSGAFSPEEATMANFKDKDLNIGQKILGTVPGLGAVMAGQQAEKRLKKFKESQQRIDFYNKFNTDNNDDTKVFALGGNLDSSLGTFGMDPINPPKKPIIDPTKISKQALSNVSVSDNNSNELFSKYADIVGIQDGVNHPKMGPGSYFYNGKTPNDPGFTPDANRSFIRKEAVSGYLNSTEGRKYSQAIAAQIKAEETSGKPVTSYSYLNPVKSNSYGRGGKVIGQDFNPNIDGYEMYRPGIENDILSGQQITDNKIPVKSDLNQSYIDSNHEQYKQKPGFLDSALRFAPIMSNYAQLRGLSSPEVEKLDRQKMQYQKQYLDEATYENQAREQASTTINALNQSGISGGQLINAQIGSQLANTKAIGDAYDKIKQFNIGENKTAQEVAMGNEKANIGQSNLEKDINARNRGNYETQKSKLQSQIGNDLGDVGKEQTYKKMVKEMFGYSWNGKYFIDDKGNQKTTEEISKMTEDKKSQDTTKKAMGGYLNNTKKSYK